MAKFCMKCGASLEENVKFCKACGTPVGETERNLVVNQAVNEVSPRERRVKQAKVPAIKSQGSSNWLIIVLALVIIGLCGGLGYYYYHFQQPQDTEIVAETENEKESGDSKTSGTEVADKGKNEQTGKSTDSKNNSLEKATAEMMEYGIGGKLNFVSTTYGHSNDGFIAVTDSGLVAVVDRKNHRAGMVSPRMNLKKFQAQVNEKYPQPMIMDCTFDNEVRGDDGTAGYWKGSTHFMSIYAQYNFDKDGNLIPGMLTTGRGENPSHFQEVLYETRNVDFANLFLTEAFSIKL